MNKTVTTFLADGKGLFKGVELLDNKTQKLKTVTADGAFIFIGLTPNTNFLKNIISLAPTGHIETNGYAETSVKGIFAAGDCRKGAIAQVAAATGEGVMASYGIKAYLSK